MKNLLNASLLLFIGVLASHAHNTGNIKGKVIDKETGQPVPYVSIIINESITGTSADINGVYFLRNIQIGTYTLTATCLGYEIAKQEVIVKENGIVITDFELILASIEVLEVTVEAERAYSTASCKAMRNIDLAIRPNRTAHDMLQMAPGLVIAQHAGGGKAEQLFLRGFDADHGTDVALSVDGIPVNMVTHGHGQGYADLHFLIPELVKEFTLYKGPYFTDFGNFCTAGAVAFETKDILENNLIKLEGGQFNTSKMTLLYQNPEGGAEQNAYFGGQYYKTDGPFKSPQDFQRLNVFGKYFTQLSHNSKITASISSFSSAWNASGQIPQRAVDMGVIDRFDGLDNFEGGTTGRQNFIIKYEIKGINSNLSVQGYFSNYNFKLFSNFTYFLEDSVNGDMIEQVDDRRIHGLNVRFETYSKLNNIPVITKLGGGYRGDNIDVALWHSPERIRLNSMVNNVVQERNLFIWGQKEFILSSKFRVQLGLRGDYFTYNVEDNLGTALDSADTGLPHFSGYAHQAMINPKLNMVYKPVRNLDIYINSGTGFHSNDARDVVIGQKVSELRKIYANRGFSDKQINQELINTNFDPTQTGSSTLPRASGAEIGCRVKLGKAIYLGFAAWYIHLEKEFVYVGDGGVTELSNPTERKGIDLEGRVKIYTWLWADADFNLSKGKVIGLPEGENRIPLAPVLTSTGGITAVHPSGFETSLRYKYIGDRPANESNTIVAKGYFVTNCGVAYNLGKLKLSVYGENLLNVDWNEAQFDTETRLQGETESVSEIHFTPGNPRNFQFGVSYMF